MCSMFIGVGDEGQPGQGRGARAPLNSGKKIFGQFLCKIRAFFRQKSCKLREFCYFFGQISQKFGYFDTFWGKNRLIFGQFVNFLGHIFRANMLCPLKLTELLRLWTDLCRGRNYLVHLLYSLLRRIDPIMSSQQYAVCPVTQRYKRSPDIQKKQNKQAGRHLDLRA